MNDEFNVWLKDVAVFVFNKGYWLTFNHPEMLDTLAFLFEDDAEPFEAAEIITA